ncbi:HAD family hydrolase [Anabaena lutea]|uniref:HAD family hydrolase n=1 Tax=Anabaena lutea TaxID=212350 RepID=UPI0018F02BEC|nr:HAD family hydrolase [Anabaena lutea]
MIKAVLFDLDGTLLDREVSLQQFINSQYDRFALQLSHIDKIDYITRFVQKVYLLVIIQKLIFWEQKEQV